MNRRIMIYVQHLLGLGHLKRMSLLADSLSVAGAEVLLVSGGMPARHVQPSGSVTFHQLPPVRAIDENFSGLADEYGAAVTDSFKAERTGQLLEAFTRFQPDTLVVELFPLGRRQMRFELLPLLDAARPVCETIACSVRDIVNRRPKREEESIDWLNEFFDFLLVHGDEKYTPISDSVAGIRAFKGRTAHTGYLTESWNCKAERHNEILVSAGGGAAGEPLFRAAAGASRLTGPDLSWRIRHGINASSSLIAELHQIAAPGAIIEPVTNDFRMRLSQCALSVSQFGYNTAMDIFATGSPAIVIPFQGSNETEQIRRAEALGGGNMTILRTSDLDAGNLAAAIADNIGRQNDTPHTINMDGLHRTTELLLGD
jgi:predicted glycosyltransferase